MKRYQLCAIVLFSVNLCLKAQILDTSSAHRYTSLDVSIVDESSILELVDTSSLVDTSTNLFYGYYPTYQNNWPFLDLGLEASPTLLLNSTQEKQVGLFLGQESIKPYFFDKDIHIYQTDKPYTRLNYSQGKNEMLSINVTHAQQISKRLSFGIDYRRIKNQNFYYSNITGFETRRLRSLFNSKFYTSYYSPNRKYEMVASYLWNKSVNTESGGLQNDTLFENFGGRNKLQSNAARFADATNSQTQNAFQLSQYWRPGGKSTDSTLDQSLAQFANQFYLTTRLDNERIEFEDKQPNTLNYTGVLDAFKDSLYHRQLSNEFGYLFAIKGIVLNASIKHSYDKIYFNKGVRTYQNVYCKTATKLQYKKQSIQALGQIGLLGYNLGDYKIKASASSKIKDFHLNLGILSQAVEPDFLEQKFYSEALFWDNDFKKEKINRLFGSAGYTMNNQRVSLNSSLETINDLIYYDKNSTIAQKTGLTSLFKFGGSYSLNTKRFGSELSYLFMNSSNKQVLPRPTSSITANAFTSFKLFKKNLNLQLGARTYWFSSFISQKYNPITRQWHIAENTFDLYPPVMLYTNAKVKSFIFGIEFFHVQQGLFGNDYYSSPSYPLMPRSMRVNIKWDLKN